MQDIWITSYFAPGRRLAKFNKIIESPLTKPFRLLIQYGFPLIFSAVERKGISLRRSNRQVEHESADEGHSSILMHHHCGADLYRRNPAVDST